MCVDFKFDVIFDVYFEVYWKWNIEWVFGVDFVYFIIGVSMLIFIF